MKINFANNRHAHTRTRVQGSPTHARTRTRNANSTKSSNANGARGGWLLYIVPSTDFLANFQNRVWGRRGSYWAIRMLGFAPPWDKA